MTFAELCQQAQELSVALNGRHVSCTLDFNASRKFTTGSVSGEYEIGVYIAKGDGHCPNGICEHVQTISQASAFLRANYPTAADESIEVGEIAEQIA